MYPITSAVKALFDAGERQTLRVTGTDKNNMPVSITDADVVVGGFGVDRYCCNGEKLEVGTAIVGQMTLKLNNSDGRFNDIVFEGTELFVEVGIADWSQSSPTVNWVPCGRFTPDVQPRRLNQIELTCFDRMTKFDEVVNGTQLTFPTTVAGLVGQVDTLCGVSLAASISNLPNAGVSIAGLPTGEGEMTYRDLIRWCAGIMATNAWIDWNGQLRFTWYNNATGYEMTVANRFDSDLYENDLTITGATYTNASGIEIVEGTDDYAIDLTGNALAGPIIATVLPVVASAVSGFVYRPFTATVVNAPYLWPMDVVTFEDRDGNDHASVLTNVAFGINGNTALESRGMTYALNRRAQPKGVTKEQAQLISEAMERVETDIDDSLTQQEIFNRLTDNGAAQGLILYNGQLYVNASYINAGYLSAARIRGDTLTLGGSNNVNGTMQVLDANGDVVGLWSNAGIIINNGEINIPFTGGRIYLGGNSMSPMMVNYSSGGVDYSLQIFGNQLRLSDGNNVLGIDPASLTVYQARSGSGRVPAVFLYGNNGQSAVINGDVPSVVLSDGTNRTYIDHEQLETGRIFLRTPLGVGNGGTGATDAAGARTNLGVTPANIGAVAKSGDTMTGPLTMNDNYQHYWVNSAGDRRWIVYPNSAGSEFYIATQEKVNGEWTNWKGVLVAGTDGTISLNQPLAVTAGGTGARNAPDARANLGVTPVLLNNSSGVTGLNVDFSTYGAFIIKMPDNVTTVVHMTGSADAEYWSTASLYGGTSSPVVLKNYCWKVNSSGTGFYLNTAKSYQINFSSTGTPSVYQITNNKFYKVWGITN